MWKVSRQCGKCPDNVATIGWMEGDGHANLVRAFGNISASALEFTVHFFFKFMNIWSKKTTRANCLFFLLKSVVSGGH